MKSKDLRERTLDDLKELEKSLSKDSFQSRFKNFTNRLDDTSSIGKARRDLARVKTLIRQHTLGIVPVAGEGGEKPKAPKKKKAAKPKAEAKSAAPAKKKAAAPKKKSSAKKEE